MPGAAWLLHASGAPATWGTLGLWSGFAGGPAAPTADCASACQALGLALGLAVGQAARLHRGQPVLSRACGAGGSRDKTPAAARPRAAVHRPVHGPLHPHWKHHIGCRKTRLRVALKQRHAVLAPLQPGGSQARQASPHHGHHHGHRHGNKRLSAAAAGLFMPR